MSYQILILLSILGWGIGSFFYKLAGNTMHPLMMSAIVTVFYMCVTPLAFIFLKFDHTITWASTGYSILGAVGTCIGSLCFFFALRAGNNTGEATALTALYPALTLALSCLFLGEPFNVKKGIGIALALASCAMLGWK